MILGILVSAGFACLSQWAEEKREEAHQKWLQDSKKNKAEEKFFWFLNILFIAFTITAAAITLILFVLCIGTIITWICPQMMKPVWLNAFKTL